MSRSSQHLRRESRVAGSCRRRINGGADGDEGDSATFENSNASVRWSANW
jgi:hypothetical protein